MVIGERLRILRKQRNLSQDAIEKRTGLWKSYISRVENGHTVPAIETLEKYARALEVPLYQLFYDGDEPPKAPNLPKLDGTKQGWGSSGKEAKSLARFQQLLSRTNERDRKILLTMAEKMARRGKA